ncbi:two-component regulator propeller domain-containing protein [Undibacterium sp. Ji83W]|uniref:sensor histidine kinase n=1 Tax=Undibacterium sp. Ji83W TaxID=3413043 RepID=UPI003BF4002B
MFFIKLQTLLKTGMAALMFSSLFIISTPAAAAVTGYSGIITPQPSRLLSDYTHTAWNGLNGAPNDVLKFAQTTDGWLWMATPTGLFRFDGVRFERMDKVQGHPLQSSNVLGLLGTPDGSLWVGYRFGGISVFKSNTVRTYTEADGLPGGTIMSMTMGPDGSIWAATREGLAVLAPAAQRFSRVGTETGLPQFMARQILFDKAGVQWVSVKGGVYFRRPGETRYTQAWPKLDLMAMAESPDGMLWASDGAYKFYRMSTSAPAGNPVPKAEIEGNGMHFDRDGVMWILRTHALERRRAPWAANSGLDQLLTKESGMSGPLPQTFFQDREGNIWIGTSHGLDRLRRNRLHILPVALPFDHPSMVSVGNGEVMTADFAGPVRSFKANGDYLEELNTHFSMSYRADDGKLWLGNDNALWRRDANKFAIFPMPHDVTGNQIQAMVIDQQQQKWVSVSRKGLFRIDNDEWQLQSGLNGLPTETVMSLAKDTSGHIWAGYLNNCIALIYSKRVQLFGKEQGLELGNVLALQADGERLWAGGEFGLALYDGKRDAQHFVQIKVSGQQALRGISGIVRTAAGDLWLHGADGISRISASEVEQLLRDPAHAANYERFNALDGLLGSPSQLRPLPSLIAASDGKLWFSTASEIATIDPQNIPRNTLPPAVEITAIRAGGKDYMAQPVLQLPKENRDIEISFTALSLSMPERISFRYQLQGYDKGWQDPHGRREAFYTNLPPGNYRFMVKAANEDGVWNEQGATMQIGVTPSFTETPGFIILLLLLAAAFLYALYLLRIRYLTAHMQDLMHERLAERARIARGLHDTLLQSVQGLIMYFDTQARRLPGDSEERAKLEQTLDLADQLMVEGREHIMDLRSESVPEELEQALQQYGSILLNERFTLTLRGKPRWLCEAVRNEIHAIAREALLNAARHSKASKVTLELEYQRDHFTLRVADNGQGLPTTIAQAGHREGHWGLVGMKERAEAMGANYLMKSVEGEGTAIQVRLPANLAYTMPVGAAFEGWSWLAWMRRWFGR